MEPDLDDIRARILAYFGAADEQSGGHDVQERPSEHDVRVAAAAVDKTRPLSMDDVCVLAYAAEIGDEAASEDVPPAMVIPALQGLLRALPPVPEAPPTHVSRAMTMASFASIGWRGGPQLRRGVACVSAVGVIVPGALASLAGTGDDPARLLNAYVLSEALPEPQMSGAIAALLSSEDAIDAATVGELVWSAMRYAEMVVAEARISALEVAVGNGALLAFAAVFGRLAVRGLDRRLGIGVDVEGAQKLTDRFVEAGFGRMRRAADVRSVLHHADTATVYVLGHLIRLAGSQEQPIANTVHSELLRRGFDVYRDLFGVTLDMPDDCIYLSYDMIDVLVEILSGTGLAVDQFADRFDALAADRLSRETRGITWIRDRRRAIALLIIAAHVAERCSDGALLAAARERAEWLGTQPGNEFTSERAPADEAERILGCRVPRC
jgi:hypothetical protein